MTAPLFATPDPEVRIRMLRVSCVVEPLDTRADAVMRRVVPRSARSRRPDGATTVSLARIRVLVDALEHAGYRVHIDDEGASR